MEDPWRGRGRTHTHQVQKIDVLGVLGDVAEDLPVPTDKSSHRNSHRNDARFTEIAFEDLEERKEVRRIVGRDLIPSAAKES